MPRAGRYASEFEEVGFLGAGGFGSVAKCRLRRPNASEFSLSQNDDDSDHYFAVKKIPLPTSNNEDDDRFLLREATNLASLHHVHIVRYFSAWLEETSVIPKLPSINPSQAQQSTSPDLTSRRCFPKLLPSATTPFYFSIRGSQLTQGSAAADTLNPPLKLHSFVRHQLLFEDVAAQPNADDSDASPSSTSSSSSASSHSSSATSSVQSSSVMTQNPKSAVEHTKGEPSSDSSQEVLFEGSRQPTTDCGKAYSAAIKDNALRLCKTEIRKKDTNLARYLYITMELVEGITLRQAISRATFVKNRRLAWQIYRQICDGVAFMHANDYVHRDLKPENVFLKANKDPDTQKEAPWTVKIGDFGLSTVISAPVQCVHSGTGERQVRGLSVGVGTQFYIAPEVLAKEGNYDQAADLFALGIILFEMIRPPMKTSMERHVILTRLIEEEGRDASAFGITDRRTLHLLPLLLSKDPSKRPSAVRLLQSLPVRVEEPTDHLLDIITSNPFSHEMVKLLSALFDRYEPLERASKFWDGFSLLPAVGVRTLTEIKAYIHSLFRTFNAVQIDLPVVVPTNKEEHFLVDDPDLDSITVLDNSGIPLLLSRCLLRLAKLTLSSVQLATVLRRFAVEPVYTARPLAVSSKTLMSSSRPMSSLRAVFDLVVDLGKLDLLDKAADQNLKDRLRRETLFLVEPVRLLWIITQTFQAWIGGGETIMTFGRLLDLLLILVLNIPQRMAESVSDLIRSPAYSTSLFKKRLKEVLAHDLAASKVDIQEFNHFCRIVREWRDFHGSAQRFIELIKANVCLKSAEDPHMVQLLNILTQVEMLTEAIQAAIGTAAAETVRWSFQIPFDTALFDSEDQFVFIYKSTNDVMRRDGMTIRFDCLRPGLKFNVLAVGGKYVGSREKVRNGNSTSAYAVEVDIQAIVNVILSSNATMTAEKASHKLWKTRWKKYLIAKSNINTSVESNPSDSSDSESDVVSTAAQWSHGHLLDKGSSQSRTSRRRALSDRQRPNGARGSSGTKVSALMSDLSRSSLQDKLSSELNGAKSSDSVGAVDKSSGSPIPSRSFPSKASQFLLLPPCSAVDTVLWLEAMSNLSGAESHTAKELSKTEEDWRLAFETAYAPPILRRFNPIQHLSVFNAQVSAMVYIVIQTRKELVAAFTLKSKLIPFRISSCVKGEPVKDFVRCRKKTKQDELCDWLVYITERPNKGNVRSLHSGPVWKMKQSECRYRLCPVQAKAYIDTSSAFHSQMLEALESADRWFDDPRMLIAKVVDFYLKLLGAMSPSLGQFFCTQAELAFAGTEAEH